MGRLAPAGVLGLALSAAASAQDRAHFNLTTGAPLRAGAYGHIEVRGATPPPLIRPEPVVVEPPVDRPVGQPVYLYVPPGQVRRWARHCARWKACDKPVLFVRMDQSPSRLGAWKQAQRRVPLEQGVLEAFSRFVQP